MYQEQSIPTANSLDLPQTAAHIHPGDGNKNWGSQM